MHPQSSQTSDRWIYSKSDEDLIDDFNTSWSTNVLGPILATQAFLPLLKKGKAKKVITLSTGLGDPELNRKSGFAAHSSYCVSKGAVEMVIVKYARKYRNISQLAHLFRSLIIIP